MKYFMPLPEVQKQAARMLSTTSRPRLKAFYNGLPLDLSEFDGHLSNLPDCTFLHYDRTWFHWRGGSLRRMHPDQAPPELKAWMLLLGPT